MINLTDKVKHKATHSKEKSDEHGEVFTPVWLIEQMLDALPKEDWTDENKTWLDPCAGKGNIKCNSSVFKILNELQTTL